MIRSNPTLLAPALALAAATLTGACGGSSRPATTTTPSSEAAAEPAGIADDPATPFAEAAVQAALAATPGVESCGADAASTMGAHFAAQRDGLVTGGDGGTAVDESFACAAQEEGLWQCQWSVFTRPTAPDPEDPCGEGGGSGYIIIVDVGADGAVAPDRIFCNAPG